MKYMGGKNRQSKKIVPVMLQHMSKHPELTTYIEPFAGACSVIEKIPSSYHRIGYDMNPHTIMAMIDVRDNPDTLPDSISEEEYRSMMRDDPRHISSWVGFACSYGGKFRGGYARYKDDNYAAEGKRSAIKQSPLLQGVELLVADYKGLNFNDCVIYCDPPYVGREGYKGTRYDYNEFNDWCMEQARNNMVFVTEYRVPPIPHEIIWEEKVNVVMSNGNRINDPFSTHERLYKVNGGKY